MVKTTKWKAAATKKTAANEKKPAAKKKHASTEIAAPAMTVTVRLN